MDSSSPLSRPPSYTSTRLVAVEEEAEEEELPAYHLHATVSPYESVSSNNLACLPYRPFPTTIRAISGWKVYKSFSLCNATSPEPLFCINIHTGTLYCQPLGFNPGLILYNGPKKGKDTPIIAAAGDQMVAMVSSRVATPYSHLFLPPFEPGKNYRKRDMERMKGASSAEHRVTYSFSLDMEQNGNWRRQQFEWRKLKDGHVEESPKLKGLNDSYGDDDTKTVFKHGGFKLVRLYGARELRATQARSEGESSTAGAAGSSQTGGIDGETVATIKWEGPLAWFSTMFTLELLGSAKTGQLSDRCIVAIVISGARLWYLRVGLKTTKTYMAAAEKQE